MDSSSCPFLFIGDLIVICLYYLGPPKPAFVPKITFASGLFTSVALLIGGTALPSLSESSCSPFYSCISSSLLSSSRIALTLGRSKPVSSSSSSLLVNKDTFDISLLCKFLRFVFSFIIAVAAGGKIPLLTEVNFFGLGSNTGSCDLYDTVIPCVSPNCEFSVAFLLSIGTTFPWCALPDFMTCNLWL